MKNFILSILSLAFLTVNAQTVNIPDPEFLKDLIKQGIDKNKDGYIQLNEAQGIEKIFNLTTKVSSIEGIEWFSDLKYLYLGSAPITSIDISKNIKLEVLTCRYLPIKELDVSKNLNLKSLDCAYNKLTTLIFGQNKSLKQVLCQGNKLVDLNVTTLDSISQLWCEYNLLTNLDVNKNIWLTNLSCGGNLISNIDLSSNISLKDFICSRNPLSSLDISKTINLENVECVSCNLTSLDISKNKKLKSLNCGANHLTNLDFTNCGLLTTFNCSDNLFKTFDFTGIKWFDNFNCAANELTHLDISKISVYYFNCSGNPNLFKICISNSQIPRTTERDNRTEHGQEEGYLIWTKDNQASYSTDCSVSVSEITKSTIQPKLLNIYNVLGQEVSLDQVKEGVYIYRYNDGSVKRIWKNTN